MARHGARDVSSLYVLHPRRSPAYLEAGGCAPEDLTPASGGHTERAVDADEEDEEDEGKNWRLVLERMNGGDLMEAIRELAEDTTLANCSSDGGLRVECRCVFCQ